MAYSENVYYESLYAMPIILLLLMRYLQMEILLLNYSV